MGPTLCGSSVINDIGAFPGGIQDLQDPALPDEQPEASNDGLMSANKEPVSANEEFQSANIELKALSEELATVKAELRNKVKELNQANSDMEYVLSASQIATAFLDRQLNIKRFTPSMAANFGLTPSDIGRAFQIQAGKIDWHDFPGDANKVLEELIQMEGRLKSRKVKNATSCEFFPIGPRKGE